MAGKEPSPGGKAVAEKEQSLPLEGKVSALLTDEVCICDSRKRKCHVMRLKLNHNNNPKLKTYSQKLRREMTKEERKIWYEFFKKCNCTVNRQKVIGNYIVDFYCASAKVVVEIDGSQHYENEGINKDQVRDQFMHSQGITVLRYSNKDINCNFQGVCTDILQYITPHPSA